MKKIYLLFTALSTSTIMPTFASESQQTVETVVTNTPSNDSGSTNLPISTEETVYENALADEGRVTPSLSDKEIEKNIRDRTTAIEKATAEISVCKSNLDVIEKSRQPMMDGVFANDAQRNEQRAKYENIRDKLTSDIVRSSQIISELFKSDDNNIVDRITQETTMLRDMCAQSLNEFNVLMDQQSKNQAPLIETKDHYTLEKTPLIETKDHYTLEKTPLVETKDHYTLEKTPFIETKDHYTLEKKSDDVDSAPVDKTNDSTLGEIEEHNSQITELKSDDTKSDMKPIDTTALQNLATKLDDYNQNVKIDSSEIINNCKRVHVELLNLKRSITKRFKKNSELQQHFSLKLKDVKAFCDNASERVVKVKFEKHGDIHQVINDVVIDSSHELKIKVDEIVNFVQQESSKQ